MTIKKLVDAVPAINKLVGLDINLKTLYRVRRLFDKIENQLKFYDEQRMKILAECGDFKNDTFVCTAGKESELESRITELLELEIEEDIKPVMISADEDIKLSCKDLRSLDNIIEIQFEETEDGENV